MHDTVLSGGRKMKGKGYSKKQQILAAVAICFAGYGAYSDSVIYPIISAILADFPGTSVVASNMFLTGASAIAAILAALLTGILMRHIRAIAMYLIFSVLAFVCSICSSFYVAENGIGNSMLVGFSQSSGKIICIVVTLIFPVVYGKFKKYIPLASAFSFALIYFFLYLAPGAGMLFLGMALLNVGMSLIPTYYQLRVSQNTPACRMGLMMGLYTISIYGANLLCPYVPTVFRLLPGCHTYTAAYLSIGIILGVLAVIYLIRLCTGREQQELDNYGQNI